MSSKMVERVAKAICKLHHAKLDCTPYTINLYKVHAKAAIEAMREPTKEMLNSYCSACDHYSCKICYQSYIDAALKE